MARTSILSTPASILVLFAASTLACSLVSADERFELTTVDGKQKSSAVRSAVLLSITSSAGGTTRYDRKKQFDSDDGKWLGYYSGPAQQVIRWPASNVGNLQVGKLLGSRVSYRKSLMQVGVAGGSTRPKNNREEQSGAPAIATERRFRYDGLPKAAPASLNQFQGLDAYRLETGVVTALSNPARLAKNPSAPNTLRLAALSQGGKSAGLLGFGTSSQSLVASRSDSLARDWTFSDAGGGLFRIQSRRGKNLHALAATSHRGVGLALPAADARQLWRPITHPRRGYVFAFESVHFPGQCLTHSGSGIFLDPFSFAPGQFWLPVNPLIPIATQPLIRNFHTDIVPNPELPPVSVRLVNSQPRAVELLLGDFANPQVDRRIRISASGAELVTLKRDAGSTVTEFSEVLMWDGSWRSQTLTTQIPPRQLYDVSVYEVRLQSIAIDRTGKSPNVIEDVNYQPRSVGRFPIPAGDAIRDGESLDVFRLAKRAQNPGAVRRFSIDELENYQAPQVVPADGSYSQPARRKF